MSGICILATRDVSDEWAPLHRFWCSRIRAYRNCLARYLESDCGINAPRACNIITAYVMDVMKSTSEGDTMTTPLVAQVGSPTAVSETTSTCTTDPPSSGSSSTSGDAVSSTSGDAVSSTSGDAVSSTSGDATEYQTCATKRPNTIGQGDTNTNDTATPTSLRTLKNGAATEMSLHTCCMTNHVVECLKRVAGVAWNTCSGCLQSFSALDYDVKHRDDVQTVDWCPSCVEWTSCPKCATACVSARQLVVHLTAIDCQLFTASSLTNLSDLLSLVPDLTSSPSTSTSVSSSSSLLSLSLSTSIPSEDPSISSLSLSTSAPYPRSSFSYSSSSSSSSFSTSSLSLSSSSSIPSLLDALRTPRLLEPTSMSAHDTLNTTNVLPSNANVLPSNTTASSSTAVLARDKLFEENVRKSRASYEQGLLQQYELEVPHELRTAAAFDDFRRRVHAHRRPQVGREKGVTQMTRRGGGGGGGSGGGGGGDTIENDTGMNGPRIRQDNLHGNASLNTCMKRKSPMHFALSGSALNGQRDTAGELADTGEYNRVTGGTRGKRDVGGMSSLTSSQPRRPFKNLSLGDHFGQDKASSSSSSSSAFNPGRVTSHTRRDDVKRDDDDGDDDDNVWNCDRCTLVNRSSSRECGACGTLNPRQQRRRCTISPTDDELKWGGPVRYGSGGTDLGKRSGPPRGRDARGIVDPAGGIGHGSGGGGDGRDSGGYGGESKGNGVRNWLEEGEVDEWGCDHCGADNSRHFDSCRRCEHKNRRLLYRESPPPLYAYSPLSPKEAIASPPPPHHSLPDYSHTSSSSSSSSLSHNTGVFSATPSRSTTSLPPSTLPPLQLLPPYSSYPSSSTYLSSFSGTAMPKPQWACRQCTLENDGRDHNCIACNLPRSSP